MGSRWLTGVGFAWPLVVAAVVAACCHAIQPEWHQFDGVLLLVAILSLLAAPVVGNQLYRWLPQKWSEEPRLGLAVVLTVPVACLQAYGELCVFVWATLRLGWVE